MKIKKEEITIILRAGGNGKRLSRTINKQMIKVNDITVLEKSIINFQNYLPNEIRLPGFRYASRWLVN